MLILAPFQHIDRIQSLVCLLLAFSFGTTFGSLIQFPCFICLFYIPIYSSFSSYFSSWFLFALFLRPALIIQPMLAFPHVLPPLDLLCPRIAGVQHPHAFPLLDLLCPRITAVYHHGHLLLLLGFVSLGCMLLSVYPFILVYSTCF